MDGRTEEFDYDLALSFAGENRALVESLAADLKALGVRVFYDMHEESDLWGKDLYQHLQHVYRDAAQYCVIFISAPYAVKVWTRHELKQAQARAIREHREYILPVRLDDTEIPGVNATTGYVDMRSHSIEDLRTLLLKKLGHEVSADDDVGLDWDGEFVEFRGDSVISYWPQVLARAQLKTTYRSERPRVRYGEERGWNGRVPNRPCHDCSAVPGEYHFVGCDSEECPFCHGQALSCDCAPE